MVDLDGKRKVGYHNKKGGTDMPSAVHRASAPLTGTLFVLIAGVLSAPAWSWDAAVTGLAAVDPSVKLSPSDLAGLAAAAKQTFDEGTRLRLICNYAYVGRVEQLPPWRIEFTIDGKSIGSRNAELPMVHSKHAVSKGPTSSSSSHATWYAQSEFAAQLEWTASGDGPRNLQCLLNPDRSPRESNVNNNITQTKVTVKRFKPLAGSDLPPVQLFKPAAGASFEMFSGLQIPLQAKVASKTTGGKKDPIEYAKASPFDERWHIEVLSKGSGALGGFESKLGEFSGPLTSSNFSAQISRAWLQQRNAKAGNYAARAYVSQTANGKTETGPSSRVDFRLEEPVSASGGMQPMPGVTALPRGSAVALPPPAIPVVRGAPSVPQPSATARTPVQTLSNLPAIQQPAGVPRQPAAPTAARMPAQVQPNLPAVQRPAVAPPRPTAPVATRLPAKAQPNLPAAQQPAAAPPQPVAPTAGRLPAQIKPNLPAIQQPAEIRLR